jgi:hypothetical protein
MNNTLPIDREALFEEIVRYLAVVDAFRAADCEPSWRVEIDGHPFDPEPERPRTRIERSTH